MPLRQIVAGLSLLAATYAQGILAPGNPPLTEQLVVEYTQAMGALLGIPVGSADIDFFRKSLQADWATKQSIRMMVLQAKRDIDSRPTAEREAGLLKIRPNIVALLQKGAASGDPEARYLLAKSAGLDDARLDSLLQPRHTNDARLDTEGIPADRTQSVYPPREARRSNSDAFDNLLSEMQTERSYLTEDDLRKMIRYFEWSLEVPLVNSERNELRRRLLALHAKNGGGQDPAFQFLRMGIGAKLGNVDLSFLDDPFADHKRRAIQREQLPRLIREGARSDLWRWLQARHEAAHPLLTPGPNALTPAVARVYAEHVVFALNEVVGKDVFAVKPELTRALLKKLLAEWPRMTEAQRKEICDLPFDWANSKQGWPYRPEHQKMELRLNWGKEFSAFFPEIKPFHEARVAEVAKAKAKIAEEQRKRASVPMTAAEQAQQSMNHQMLAMQMATMAMSNQMQMQQQTFQAMQNAQLHMHVANLNIASNIGGGNTTWHVVYR